MDWEAKPMHSGHYGTVNNDYPYHLEMQQHQYGGGGSLPHQQQPHQLYQSPYYHLPPVQHSQNPQSLQHNQYQQQNTYAPNTQYYSPQYNQQQQQQQLQQPHQSSAASKRDKRRLGFVSRLNQITEAFENDRDTHYRDMLHTLQSTLASLHSGDNPELLEEIGDVEETRDAQLAKLRLWEQYQLERATKEYEREVKQANDEHATMMDMVKDRLMNRLEAQRKKLREDKALLDIANDHSVFLSSNYANGNGLSSFGGSGGGNGGSVPGSPGGGGTDRRSLRRRQELASATLDELSGLSGTEGSRPSKRMATSRSQAPPSGSGGGGRLTGVSDAEILSDREVLEGVLFAKERDVPTTRHTTRSYQGVPVLKPEEAMEDLALIRSGQKRKR